jgi:hypothetical protein
MSQGNILESGHLGESEEDGLGLLTFDGSFEKWLWNELDELGTVRFCLCRLEISLDDLCRRVCRSQLVLYKCNMGHSMSSERMKKPDHLRFYSYLVDLKYHGR